MFKPLLVNSDLCEQKLDLIKAFISRWNTKAVGYGNPMTFLLEFFDSNPSDGVDDTKTFLENLLEQNISVLQRLVDLSEGRTFIVDSSDGSNTHFIGNIGFIIKLLELANKIETDGGVFIDIIYWKEGYRTPGETAQWGGTQNHPNSQAVDFAFYSSNYNGGNFIPQEVILAYAVKMGYFTGFEFKSRSGNYYVHLDNNHGQPAYFFQDGALTQWSNWVNNASITTQNQFVNWFTNNIDTIISNWSSGNY